MIKIVIDIGKQAYIYTKHKQLFISRDKKVMDSIPIEDIGVILLHHPAISFSQSAIITCQKHNVVVVFCDERHLPYSVILPLVEGHSLHQKVLQKQIEVRVTVKKRLWQQIIKQKICEQSKTLLLLNKYSGNLMLLHNKVKSGDSENHEAQAAQKYWRLLFGESFRRNRDGGGINTLLNYGYAIIRAMLARAIVGTGLHPALGIHHHNQYNGLCLADDLMEPFRPWVDQLVCQISQNITEEVMLDKDSRKQILQLISDTVVLNNKKMPMLVASHYFAANLKRCIIDKTEHLEFPVLESRENK